MRLEHLEYLLEIAKQNSITGAARKLCIRQTTLNSILLSAERELGFELFQRSAHTMVVTHRGEHFFTKAREILVLYRDMDSLKETPDLVPAPVRLVLSSSVASGFALAVNRAFTAASPSTALIFQETTQQDIGTRLVQNAANVGLSHYSIRSKALFDTTARKYGVSVEPLLEDRFYLLVNRDHPLAGRGEVELSELYTERIATGTGFKWAPMGISLSPLYRNGTRYTAFPNTELIKRAVLEQGMVSVLTGCALFYDGMFDPEVFSVLRLKGMMGGDTTDICLFQNHPSALNYAERTLVDCIRAVAADLSSRQRELVP